MTTIEGMDDPAGIYLTFELASESYAIEIVNLDQIGALESPRRIPNVPRYVLGLMEFDAGVIPVIDMRMKLDLEDFGSGESRWVIVVKALGEDVGLVVDAVSEVVRFRPDDREDIPQLGAGAGAAGLRGVVRAKDRLCLLLDLDEILAIEDVAPLHVSRQP